MKRQATLLALVLLTGCMATPKTEMAGDISEKNISFPKVNQKTYVVANGLVHIKTSYKSGYQYKLKQDFSQSVQIGLASINVRRDERLIPSTLDGKDYHCAVTNVYRDLIGFSNNKVCFGETNGKFTVLRYAPGSYWFTLDLLPPLETIKTEVITSINGGYTKKELVYNGSNKNTLTFIEREYTSNLETPSKTKPIAIVVDATPKVVEVSGALINVIEYNNNSLTLTLEKPFD